LSTAAKRQMGCRQLFSIADHESLTLIWQAQPLDAKILGKIILILRPKRILDEDYNRELWQLDE
jgi:hypothetical protein